MKNLHIFIALILALSVSACSSGYKSQSSNYDDIYYTPVDEEFAVNEQRAPAQYDNRSTQQGQTSDSRFGYEGQQSEAGTERYVDDQGNSHVTNNYYYDRDDYYDYAYSARLRRFHNPVGFGYYNNFYTNTYWYDYNPYSYGTSIYLGYNWWRPRWNVGFGWNNWGGWNMGIGYGFGGYHNACYDPFGWNYGWGWFNPRPWYGNYWAGYNQGYWNGFHNGFYNGFYGNAYNPYYFNSFDYTSYHYGPRATLASNNRTHSGGRTLSQLHESRDLGDFASNDVYFGKSEIFDNSVGNNNSLEGRNFADSPGGSLGKDKDVVSGKARNVETPVNTGRTESDSRNVEQSFEGKTKQNPETSEPARGKTSVADRNPSTAGSIDNNGKNSVATETPRNHQTRPKGYDVVGESNQGSFSNKGRTGSTSGNEGVGETRPRTFEGTPRTYEAPRTYERAPQQNQGRTPNTYESAPRTYEAPRSYERAPQQNQGRRPNTYQNAPRTYETPRTYEAPRSYERAPQQNQERTPSRSYQSTPRSYESNPGRYESNPRTGNYRPEPRQNSNIEYYRAPQSSPSTSPSPRQSAPSKSYERRSNSRSSAPSYRAPSGGNRSYSTPPSSGGSKSRSSGGSSGQRRR